LVFGRGKKRNATAEILDKIKAVRDLIDLRGSVSPSELRGLLRSIADSSINLKEDERDRLAREIEYMFEEKISIRRGWREEKIRTIRSLLKEIAVHPRRNDPLLKPKIMRAKQLDMQIRMDDASIETMLQIKDIIIDTIRRGVEPTQAWASIIRLTNVISGFAEELTAMQEEYESTLMDMSPDVTDLMESYGLKSETERKAREAKALKEEKSEVEEDVRELIEKYGSE